MENAHSRELTHAIRQNLKSDTRSVESTAVLCEGKEIIKRHSGKEQQYTYVPEDPYIENFATSRRCLDSSIPGGSSAFSPIERRSATQDESVVSSTTNDHKEKAYDSSSHQASTDPRHPDDLHHQQRRHRRQNQITETAAASSTTSFEDDEKRLQVQNNSGRGRKGGTVNEPRPPSCGTPLGKIKEEHATSTTTENDPGFEKTPLEKQKSKSKDGAFLKPADPTTFAHTSASQTFLFGTSQHSEGAEKLTPHTLGSHFSGDQQFRDGRHPFDPRHMPMLTGQGLGGSPILSDIPMIPISPDPMSGLGGINPFNQNSSLEFYMGGFTSPTMSMLSQARNLSPRHSTQDLEKMNYPFYGTSSNIAPSLPGSQGHMTSLPGGFPTQGLSPLAYYQLMQQQQRLLASSFDKPDELGRFPSPLCRSRARKRPLSISPAFSDNLDITAMIRTSPNSLLPFGGLNRSRSSSVASCGSYGHLAAGSISPTGYLSGYNASMMTSPQHLQFLSRQMSFPGHTGNGLPTNHLAAAVDKTPSGMFNPFHPMGSTSMNFPPQLGLHTPGKNPQNPSHLLPQNRNDNKNSNASGAEPVSPSVNLNTNNNIGVSPASHVTNDDNDVVYETNCDWENCSLEFDTQEQLVHHINNDHIHGDKKEFVCRWKNCARDQRPFKAQYMLVVHMRRHTGEKPHKCNFKGCSKAYSRLENLKTHLRSHTGEKPYVCEYPSCTKAFSNASDRAKHQNRTHSNEKPYACKIADCTKRYTDPSSLRKHVKTVHGPEAHVTKRMKANREREEKKSEMNVKQEPGVEKEKRKPENGGPKQNCQPTSRPNGPASNDMNPPSNMNPKSNQSSYTSGSDVTPHHSPHMTSQNNDSGVDVNVGANEGDSDGDIVVDENPLPDSTSGGVGVQARRRAHIKTSLVPRHFSKKMATLSIGGAPYDRTMGEYPSRTVETSNMINERLSKQGVIGGGTTEVSSSSIKGKLIPMKSNPSINTGSMAGRRQMALINQDRRDSGTVSDVSRKSSMTSQGSRRNSQMSNVGINVAGSYDPISLDSSRRSSSNSAVTGPRHSASNSNAPAINSHELHRLRSTFNELTGRPPPTPISGESYSKGQMSRWQSDDERYRVSSGQDAGNPHTFHSSQPQMGPPHPPEQTVRRRSEGAYMRSIRTPQPSDMQGQAARRASDPIRKASQMDPNKLPSVQRHNSWNNMTPLPGIRGRNSSQEQPNQCASGNPNAQGHRGTEGNGSYFSNESDYQMNGRNMALHQSQALHQPYCHQQHYHPHGGVNEHVLLDHLNADMMAGSQPGMEDMIKNQSIYGNVMSPNGNTDVIHSRPMPQGGYASMNTPRSFQSSSHPMNQPIRGHHVINGQPQRQYNNAHAQMNSDVTYNNAQANGHVMMHQAAMTQQNMACNSITQHYSNYDDCPDLYHTYNQQMAQAGMRQAMQNHVNSSANHSQPLGSMYHSQANTLSQHNPAAPGNAPVTPRPPSNSSASQQNRLRLARIRPTGATSALTSSSVNTPPGAQQGGTNRVNCTPDAQIPDEFLQQEFIDSIPELQPELIGSSNQAPSHVKMPADSTTGPDGDVGDDNDDAMSITNTDVTLPPMSAFSSRLATPLLNNPYPPQHPLAGSQRPASNMAINSMSSMLSTLEEENKYLNMIPPTQ